MEMIPGIFEFLKKLAPSALVTVAIVSGTVLFCSDDLVMKLGVKDLREGNRTWMGLTFLGATSLSVVNVSKWVSQQMQERREKKKQEETRMKSLRCLTGDEKGYLVPFVFHDEATQYYRLQDGVTGSLQAKGIIYRSSNLGDIDDGFAFCIQPWAKERLQQHPEFLEGARTQPPTSRRRSPFGMY